MNQKSEPKKDDKATVLEKLLQHGAEGVDALTQITGWPVEITRHALLQLIVAGRVKCLRGDGRQRYALRSEKDCHVR